jgi:hypothetical protein
LLGALARGEAVPEMASVLARTDQLEAELPKMLSEHKAIVVALEELREAAERAGRSDIAEFARNLEQHARIEEEVMYPAAILVGQVVRQRLGEKRPAASK